MSVHFLEYIFHSCNYLSCTAAISYYDEGMSKEKNKDGMKYLLSILLIGLLSHVLWIGREEGLKGMRQGIIQCLPDDLIGENAAIQQMRFYCLTDNIEIYEHSSEDDYRIFRFQCRYQD